MYPPLQYHKKNPGTTLSVFWLCRHYKTKQEKNTLCADIRRSDSIVKLPPWTRDCISFLSQWVTLTWKIWFPSGFFHAADESALARVEWAGVSESKRNIRMRPFTHSALLLWDCPHCLPVWLHFEAHVWEWWWRELSPCWRAGDTRESLNKPFPLVIVLLFLKKTVYLIFLLFSSGFDYDIFYLCVRSIVLIINLMKIIFFPPITLLY